MNKIEKFDGVICHFCGSELIAQNASPAFTKSFVCKRCAKQRVLSGFPVDDPTALPKSLKIALEELQWKK